MEMLYSSVKNSITLLICSIPSVFSMYFLYQTGLTLAALLQQFRERKPAETEEYK